MFTAFVFRTTLTHAFLIPKNSWQSVLEILHNVIPGVVDENAGPKPVKYFPSIPTIFIIIPARNLPGMIPHSFTVTSHPIVTSRAAPAVSTGVNTIGIMKNRTHSPSPFLPPGAPMALAPLPASTEFASHVSRVSSLSIRPFANSMSGHTSPKILSGFARAAVSSRGIYLVPTLAIFLATGSEPGIAMTQAHTPPVLLCTHLNDAVNLH
jgi:F-type H+-transporting ATPase subunit a